MVAFTREIILTHDATASHAVPFHANWDSLAQYRTPEWFRDAKFGIFLHWGVYSVAAFANEWYSRNMYIPGNPAYEHQIATYGPQSKFGYKDFIPMFRAERFDPNARVDLFVRAASMDPHRDVVGELATATRARGLRFGVSSHVAEHDDLRQC
jgi:alpha-L-fucosidase